MNIFQFGISPSRFDQAIPNQIDTSSYNQGPSEGHGFTLLHIPLLIWYLDPSTATMTSSGHIGMFFFKYGGQHAQADLLQVE